MPKNSAPAKMRLRSNNHAKNITKRGQGQSGANRDTGSTVGPVVLGFFLFVVVGSAILQIIQVAQSGR